MIGTSVHLVGAGWRRVWARDGVAVCVAAAMTIVVEVGLWALLRAKGVSPDRAVLTTLAAMSLWVPVAASAWAVGGATVGSCLLRGGEMADASAVALIVFWLTGAISFVAAAKLYCIFMAVAILASAIVSLSCRVERRVILVGVATVVCLLLLASPVWLAGPAGVMPESPLRSLTVWSATLNPFFAVADAISADIPFVWTDRPVMYRLTPLGGRLAVPAVSWAAPLIYLLPVGIVLSAAGAGARRVTRARPVAPPAAS